MDTEFLMPLIPQPPFYKQVLVALLVGVTIGPVVGWFIGTFATFFAVAMTDPSVPGMRVTGFVGGLMGIPFGLIVGPLVSLPLRILSWVFLTFLKNVWFGSVLGAILGLGSGLLIHQYWHPSPQAFVYTVMHSIVVGSAVGAATVIAKPKWL
jgi:hypothetical protein